MLSVGSTHTWSIPVADTDGDIVRCRWATSGPPDECASSVPFLASFLRFDLSKMNRVCNGLPGAYLDNQACTMNYTTTAVGLWVVALKIEDFQYASDTVPLSGISLQFIVNVRPSTNSSISRRKFFDFLQKKILISFTVPIYCGTWPSDSCVVVSFTATINDVVQFFVGGENVTISNIDMKKPTGKNAY